MAMQDNGRKGMVRRRLAGAKFRMYPGLGLIGTAVGTTLAIFFMPSDPFPSGALFFSAAMLTTGLLLAPVLASIENPRAILRLEYILVLGVIYWLLLDLLQGSYDLYRVKAEAIEHAFLAIGLFAAGIFVAGFFRPWRIPQLMQSSVATPVETRVLFRLILLFFVLGIFRFAYTSDFNPVAMIYYLGVNRWAAPWGRGALGGWDAFLDHMKYFGYLVPLLTVAIAMKTGWLRRRSLVAIALSLTMLAFLAQGGSRRIIGVVAGAALIYWILGQKQLNVRNAIVILTSMVAIVYVLEVMLQYRNVGLSEFVEAGPAQVEMMRIHVDQNFFRLAQVTQIVPEEHPYVYHKQVIYTLFRPVPRVFWEGKPTNPGFDLAEFLGLQGVTLSASVISEWYLTGGFIVIFLGGWLYGQLARMGNRLLAAADQVAPRLLFAISAMTLFAGLRSMIELVLMSYMMLVWLIGWWIVVRRRSRKHVLIGRGAP